MGFDQYHEPPNELPQKTRTFARMILSVIEEAQAIDWYEQRMAVEKDKQAKAIMKNAQKEEFKHFGMDLEFLLRQKPEWREILKGILFTEGDIVKADAERVVAAAKANGRKLVCSFEIRRIERLRYPPAATCRISIRSPSDNCSLGQSRRRSAMPLRSTRIVSTGKFRA